jgi:hypothetical protein
LNNLFGSLNLSTQERRIVVITGTILFILLNFWLVWPRFKDWAKVQASIAATEETLRTYKGELARTNEHQIRLKKLETAGSQVLPEDQANKLIAVIQSQAVATGLVTAGIRPLGRPGANANTNRFFEEQTVEVGINPTDDNNLVAFLVAIGAGDSMIRVKDLQLRPDATQSKLQGRIQLVASFQKKVAPAPAPPPPKNEKMDVPKSFTRAKPDAAAPAAAPGRTNALAK